MYDSRYDGSTKRDSRGLVVQRARTSRWPCRKEERWSGGKEPINFFFQKVKCASSVGKDMHDVVIGLDKDGVLRYFYSTCDPESTASDTLQRLGGFVCGELAHYMLTMLEKEGRTRWRTTPTEFFSGTSRVAKGTKFLVLDQCSEHLKEAARERGALPGRNTDSLDGNKTFTQRAKAQAERLTSILVGPGTPISIKAVGTDSDFSPSRIEVWALPHEEKVEDTYNSTHRRKRYKKEATPIRVAVRENGTWTFDRTRVWDFASGAFGYRWEKGYGCKVCDKEEVESRRHHRSPEHKECVVNFIYNVLWMVPGTKRVKTGRL